jgi:hypothetical protein
MRVACCTQLIHRPVLQRHIARHILSLRDQRVMLDADLAALHGVETKVPVQATERNSERFPGAFMFQLDAQEWASLRSQFVTSNTGRGGRRYAPYAFIEQGVAMLSSVLNSPRAIAINIEIMRAFVQVRSMAATHQDLARQLSELQDKTESKKKPPESRSLTAGGMQVAFFLFRTCYFFLWIWWYTMACPIPGRLPQSSRKANQAKLLMELFGKK